MAALANKNRYQSLLGAVPQGMITPDTNVILQWYGLYFNTYPQREHVDFDELETLVRLRSAPDNPEGLAITCHLINQLREPVAEDSLAGIISQLYDLDFAGRAGAIISDYNAGKDIDVSYEIQQLATSVTRSKGQSDPATFIDTSIGELLARVADDKGIKFRRISVLRDGVLGLQGGASVAIAARPDKGKTSLLADVLTDFAPQCVDFFGPDRPILWLCNEGNGDRIIPRIYQAALGKDLTEVISMSNAGTLEAAYMQAIGADLRYIRVKNAHGMSLAQIEQVIDSMRPCVVVYDMLANVKLGKGMGGGNKADEVEQLWQQVRELAVLKDHIALSTVQVSIEGANQLYPPDSAMKDSKTAAQGASDVIIMLGSLTSPDAWFLRGISTPKNKFAPPGGKSLVQSEVIFKADICRFEEGQS